MGEAAAPRVRRSTENLETCHLYLQGRYWWNKRQKGAFKKGLGFFEQTMRGSARRARRPVQAQRAAA